MILDWRVFSLPVYHDYVVVLGMMADISLSDVLLTTAGHPSYYSPVGLATLKILQLLADGTYPVPDFACLLFCSLCPGWLGRPTVPLGGLYPFEQWLPGQRWQETRLIEAPVGVPSGCLRARVGLYHPDTGERVLLEDGGEFVMLGR